MTTDPSATRHPLEPLDAEEIRAAVAAVRATGRLPDTALFAMVTLDEPDRAQLAAYASGTPVPRHATAVVLPRPDASVIEVTVGLPDGGLVEWVERDGVRPALLFDDSYRSILALKADPRWLEAMAKRGITDPDTVQIDPWPTGHFGNPDEEGRRITRCLSYYREDPDDNGYAATRRRGAGHGGRGPGRGARGARLRGGAPAARTRHLPVGRQRARPRRPEAARDRPTRGGELHPGRAPAELAEVVDAPVHASAGGPGAPHGGLRRRRHDPAPAPPGLHLRDGRPLRRSGADARVEERLRRRRVGTRPHGQLTDPRVRLPRRDHLCGRRLRLRARPRPRPGERHLHPRGGLRDPLEAQRHEHRALRGPPVPSPGGLLHRHGGQLRVRLLLVLLPGRVPAARGQADRHHVHPGGGGG